MLSIAQVIIRKYDNRDRGTGEKKGPIQYTLLRVMNAVGQNPKLISYRLYKELERYSKVILSFYKEFEDKIKSLIN